MISLTILLAVVGLAASGTASDTSYNKIINFPAASKANYISFNPELSTLTGLTTGNAVININGKAVITAVVKKGKALTAGGTFVIGQEQDRVGGGFDSTQTYIGNLYNINMWDRALTQAEIASMFNEGICGIFFAGLSGSEPIISYADILAKEMHGDVSVVDGECDVVECPETTLLRIEALRHLRQHFEALEAAL
ncbi:serum amyloid P-component-like [Bolinopsis microptera]|uniref:serum amyloid P-component-like n=1 Tax=Bolinopsis microptera TaxID=2820187 RepID=UPI003078CC54